MADANKDNPEQDDGELSSETVWVQLYCAGGSQPIGEPSEFVRTKNVSALKKEVKNEYVELMYVSPACLEVWNGGGRLQADAPVPQTAAYEYPVRVVAYPPTTMPHAMPGMGFPQPQQVQQFVAATSPSPIRPSPPPANTKRATARKKPAAAVTANLAAMGITNVEPIKEALLDLLKPYLERVQQAGCLVQLGDQGASLTPVQVLQAKAFTTSAAVISTLDVLSVCAEWRTVYQMEGMAVLQCKMLNFQQTRTYSDNIRVVLSQDPRYLHLKFLVLGERSNGAAWPGSTTPTDSPAKKKAKQTYRLKTPTAKEIETRTTRGDEHKAMPCRFKRRRCSVCKLDTAHECTHEQCQLVSRELKDGRILLGVPVCRDDKGKDCIQQHRALQQQQREVLHKLEGKEESKTNQDEVVADTGIMES